MLRINQRPDNANVSVLTKMLPPRLPRGVDASSRGCSPIALFCLTSSLFHHRPLAQRSCDSISESLHNVSRQLSSRSICAVVIHLQLTGMIANAAPSCRPERDNLRGSTPAALRPFTTITVLASLPFQALIHKKHRLGPRQRSDISQRQPMA